MMARSFIFLSLVISALGATLCPSGTYYSAADGMCYYAYNGTLSWASALNFCYGIGGELVVPKNGFENTMFISILQDLGLQIFGSWLGAYSTDIGIWYDSKENLVTYTRWGPYQPMYNGSCASIGSDGYWFADHCESKEEFICRIKPESNVTTTTSRPTLPLLTTKATNAPAQPTIDPNPVNCPGYDRMNSTTPCSSGWHFYLPTCSCYIMSTKTLSWFEAEQNCVNYKAHLASVHSQSEAVYIKSLTSDSTKMIQIGLQYNQGWQWSDGTPITFLNFAPRISHPDYNNNPCGAIFSDGYYFATYMGNGPCNVRYSHSVCKKPLMV